MEINKADFPKYEKRLAEGFKLPKSRIVDGTYTEDDVIMSGIRYIERNKKWYKNHSSESQKAKMAEKDAKIAEMEAKLVELEGEPSRTGEDN